MLYQTKVVYTCIYKIGQEEVGIKILSILYQYGKKGNRMLVTEITKKIEEIINQIVRQRARHNDRENNYKDIGIEKLSKHGMWSQGYECGMTSAYENAEDKLIDLLKEITKEGNEKD